MYTAKGHDRGCTSYYSPVSTGQKNAALSRAPSASNSRGKFKCSFMKFQSLDRIVGNEYLLIHVVGYGDCHLHRDYKFSSRQRLFDAAYLVGRNEYDVDDFCFLISAKCDRQPKLREKESPEMVSGCENTKSFGIDVSISAR